MMLITSSRTLRGVAAGASLGVAPAVFSPTPRGCILGPCGIGQNVDSDLK